MATPEPVLTLSTVVDRKIVRVDGVNYELRSSDEMPYLAIRGHARTFRDAAPLLSMPRRNATQERALKKVMKPLVKAILIAPDSVHNKLSHDHRMAIVEVFSLLRAVEIRAAQKAAAGAKAGTARKTSGRTTGKSAPG